MLDSIGEDPKKYKHDIEGMVSLLANYFDLVEETFPFLIGLYTRNHDAYGFVIEKKALIPMKRVGNIYTRMGSAAIGSLSLLGGEWSIEIRNCKVELSLEGQPVFSFTDASLHEPFLKVVRRFTTQPEKERIRQIKRAANRLRKKEIRLPMEKTNLLRLKQRKPYQKWNWFGRWLSCSS